jgi:hypothetical protein
MTVDKFMVFGVKKQTNSREAGIVMLGVKERRFGYDFKRWR